MRPLTVLAAFVFAAGAQVPPASAQISPGPLSRPHAEFDQTSTCLKCHARGEDMSVRCLSCHTEIRQLVERRQGFHGREGGEDCKTCHPDHAGRDFNLIHWEGGPQSFDHRRAGWPLEDAHARVECRTCHRPKFHQPFMAAHLQVRDRSRSWLALDTRCASCHEDPHKNRFGADCQTCHSQAEWHTIKTESFNHDRTSYPLHGKHASVACEKCHDEKTAWGRKPRFDTCGACHEDAHAGRARVAGKVADCASCHDERGFHPSTMPIAAHDRTDYPLRGRHAKVACSKCHTKNPKGVDVAMLGEARVWMTPAHKACLSCHANPHGNQLAGLTGKNTCEACHRVAGFRPSRFTIKDHGDLRFPLREAHAKADCRTCHAAKRRNLPPLPASRAGTAGFVFALNERECQACHRDPHAGKLRGLRGESGCLACHDQHVFRPSRVDVRAHDAFDFKLVGAHRAVPCFACHKNLKARTAASSLLLAAHGANLSFSNEARDCASCHDTPHGDQFSKRRDKGACDACHDSGAFQPASRFDHGRDTRFNLDGAHAKTPCSSCHQTRVQGKSRIVMYRGTPSECTRCHTKMSLGHDRGDQGPRLLLTSREVRNEPLQ